MMMMMMMMMLLMMMMVCNCAYLSPMVKRQTGPYCHLCSSPFLGHWTHRWIDHYICDAWPVQLQTYGCLPSHKASPPFGRYQIVLLSDRGTWVWTTWYLIANWLGVELVTLRLGIQCDNHWATKPVVILLRHPGRYPKKPLGFGGKPTQITTPKLKPVLLSCSTNNEIFYYG